MSVDYAALAEQARQAAPPKAAPVDYAALAAQARGEAPADFQSTNAKDASGAAAVDPNTVGTFASHFGSQINPLTIVQSLGQTLPIPKALGGGGIDAPLRFVQQAVFPTEILQKAAASFKQGDYVSAARHFIDYVLPVIGPALEHPADEMQQGKYAAGMGDAIGLGTALFGAEGLSNLVKGAKIGPVAKNANAADRAAVEFGQREGVPVDAATATGNRFVRTVQKTADESLGGNAIGQRARAAQDAALDATGHRLADQAFPRSVTAEGAGKAITDALTQKIDTHKAYADRAYERLRAIEADSPLLLPEDVPPAVKARMKATAGEMPTGEDIQGLRRIVEELRALPFQAGKLITDGVTEDGAPREIYTPRQAGAKVYHDILQEAPGTADMTRAEVENAIDKAIETGQFTNAAKGALIVARKRLSDPYLVSRPLLEPDAGAKYKTVLLPVDTTAAKTQLRPIYEQLMREKDIAPAMGAKGRALVALDRFMRAPDHAPVSIVDAALSDLKALSRETDGRGQGVVKQAVKAIDAAVQFAVAQAGPEATRALRDGRAATSAHYQALDVLDRLRAEPVQAYRQMTAPKDAGIDLLRTVQREAPQAMPDVARAYLDDLLNTATAEGGFKRTDKLWADWQKLGGATKKALFPKAGQTEALDQFFLLAKRIGENPNPSGSGFHVAKTGEIVLLLTNPTAGVPLTLTGTVLAKALHSPAVVKALTQGLQLSRSKASPAMYATAAAAVMHAAREAGVPMPATADQSPASASPTR